MRGLSGHGRYRLPCETLARLAARRKTRAKEHTACEPGPRGRDDRAAATMTAAGRLGRLAALLLLLPALARGWDWSTNVESTFDCKTHRNPIQLYKEELFKCQGGADDHTPHLGLQPT